jgi:hypothetical protein
MVENSFSATLLPFLLFQGRWAVMLERKILLISSVLFLSSCGDGNEGDGTECSPCENDDDCNGDMTCEGFYNNSGVYSLCSEVTCNAYGCYPSTESCP